MVNNIANAADDDRRYDVRCLLRAREHAATLPRFAAATSSPLLAGAYAMMFFFCQIRCC